jgi:uncharacterized protein (TIGR02996 family)
MSIENQNPEDAFWRMIESDPTNPSHRLLFADWCDENDKPIMADVQRWLAATGRAPTQVGLLWIWSKGGVAQLDRSNLPQKLFRALEKFPNYIRQNSITLGVAFLRYREAEEALVPAWLEAIRRRWFSRSWKPTFLPISFSNTTWDNRISNDSESGQLPGIVIGVLLLVILRACSSSPNDRSHSPSPARFELKKLETKPTSQYELLQANDISIFENSATRIPIVPPGRTLTYQDQVLGRWNIPSDDQVTTISNQPIFISPSARGPTDYRKIFQDLGWSVGEKLVIPRLMQSNKVWEISLQRRDQKFTSAHSNRLWAWEQTYHRILDMEKESIKENIQKYQTQ